MLETINALSDDFPEFFHLQLMKHSCRDVDFTEDRRYFLINHDRIVERYRGFLENLVESKLISCANRLQDMHREINIYFLWSEMRNYAGRRLFHRDILFYSSICQELAVEFDIHETHLRRSLHHHERSQLVANMKRNIVEFEVTNSVVTALQGLCHDHFVGSILEKTLNEPRCNKPQTLSGFAIGLTSNLGMEQHNLTRLFIPLSDYLVTNEPFISDSSEDVVDRDHIALGRVVGHAFYEDIYFRFAGDKNKQWFEEVSDLRCQVVS